ncbi:MAG: 3-isopropylmalate dehydratase small subunit [Bacteroidales bacterium]|nr:MAG: 3-isopropylmalate dehydratase small subunit [Bacteroidales bacterium]
MSALAFKNITSTAVPLGIDNVDTDQIIPARYLKAVTRGDFGKNLFADWRYNSDGSINKDFILNNPIYEGQILLTGKNFGCGSSREHAAWALSDYGFKVILSSHFADIFKNNALNNGILPIQISEEIIANLLKLVSSKPETKFIVDLDKQIFSTVDKSITENFQINAFKKECMLKGYDSIDYLINLRDKVERYEGRKVG